MISACSRFRSCIETEGVFNEKYLSEYICSNNTESSQIKLIHIIYIMVPRSTVILIAIVLKLVAYKFTSKHTFCQFVDAKLFYFLELLLK